MRKAARRAFGTRSPVVDGSGPVYQIEFACAALDIACACRQRKPRHFAAPDHGSSPNSAAIESPHVHHQPPLSARWLTIHSPHRCPRRRYRPGKYGRDNIIRCEGNKRIAARFDSRTAWNQVPSPQSPYGSTRSSIITNKILGPAAPGGALSCAALRVEVSRGGTHLGRDRKDGRRASAERILGRS